MLWHSLLSPLFAQADQAAPGAWYEEPWFLVVSVLLILIVPYMLGEMISRKLRMPDYGWKIGLIFVAIVAGIAIDVTRWPPRLGIDLKGGVKLIYELDQSKLRSVNVDQLLKLLADEANKAGAYGKKKAEVIPLGEGRLEIKLPTADAEKADKVEAALAKLDLKSKLGVTLSSAERRSTDGGISLTYQAEHDAGAVDMEKLVTAIVKRVNPGGQREVAIRKIGNDQIEVAIPDVDKAEIDLIKTKISSAGALEFRIVADSRFPDHAEAIDAAKADLQSRSNEVSNGEQIVAQWVDLPKKVEDRGGKSTWLIRTINGQKQVLVMRDPYDVTGGYLSNASSSVGEEGNQVNFSFNSEGASRFGELTGQNLPDPVSGVGRDLAIVLDGTLTSAATIRSRISDSGRITGSFSDQDVNIIVDVLNAGALPAALQKEPVSEERISAELGQDTIQNSFISMIASTAAVLLFMLFYYRFAGIVANAAVIFNLVLVLALMIVFKAAFTLAGLAGLVLSVGMAVDSNVLIYERMREEKERGAALRMVIRNGFGRAMATIIDTHSTTIITGVILYVIGTEQLRGFAVTLVMGLAVNLFTAVFCARVVFDIAERQRWLTELKMLKLFGETKIDFVSIMKPAIAISILISAAGIVAVCLRGSTILDVDFTGGCEVQIAFNPDKAEDVSQVRKALDQPDVAKILPDATVSAVTSAKGQENTQFVIRTSNDKIKEVEDELSKVFGDRLRHYKAAKFTNQHRIEAKTPAPSAPEAGQPKSSSRATTGTQTPSGAPPPAVPPTAETPKPDTGKTDANKTDAGDNSKSGKSESDNSRAGAKTAPAPEPNKGSHLPRLDRVLLAFAAPDALLADDNGAKPAADAQSNPAPKSAAANAKTAPDTQSNSTNTAADAKPIGSSPADTKKVDETAGSKSADAKPSVPEAPSTEKSRFAARVSAAPGRDSFVGGTEVTLQFDDPIKFDSLKELLDQTIDPKEVQYDLSNPEYAAGSKEHAFNTWTLRLSVPPEQASVILSNFAAKLESTPVFLGDSTIGSRVAADTERTAIVALIASIAMIVVYIWIRFQNVIYGIGAVVALVHDVLVTVAGVALSYYVAGFLGFLLVDPFKISLNVVAALLTIVGYSISDTIVIFDRIREVRGKSPDLNEEMINKSVNQTLSRTVLTVFTVLLVTIILYIAGGQAIHAFAFTMLIGLISGTYSSVYIAAPCLLWLKLPGGQGK
ncbi:MAG TPA: protein translocase subunit SecD [Pirellulales bacterium]|jgi:SecD/SecF fusion protein|nr:protein translocase subunit SecD [Pirellulales bacterium]